MSHRYGWRRLLLCAVLEFAALTGAPLRPKDIENVLRPANEVASQQVSRKDNDEPDPILEMFGTNVIYLSGPDETTP